MRHQQIIKIGHFCFWWLRKAISIRLRLMVAVTLSHWWWFQNEKEQFELHGIKKIISGYAISTCSNTIWESVRWILTISGHCHTTKLVLWFLFKRWLYLSSFILLKSSKSSKNWIWNIEIWYSKLNNKRAGASRLLFYI